MNASILIGTHGDPAWRDLARARAYASALELIDGGVEVLVEHQPGGTLAGVRNHLAGRAARDWLCFLDADDELCPGYLDAMHIAAARVLVDSSTFAPALLAPAVLYCDGGRARGPARIPNAGRWPDTNECVIGTLIPRALFLAVGGFRELPSLEDWDLWLRAVKAGARIVHVPDAVYVAHVNPAGRNSDQSVYDELRAEHAEVWERRR